MDASFLAGIFSEALAISQRWTAEQARTESLLAALIAFHARLQLLGAANISVPHTQSASRSVRSVRIFNAGRHFEDVPSRLIARHICGVENLMGALRSSVRRFEEYQMAMAEVHAAVWQEQQQQQRHQQQKLLQRQKQKQKQKQATPPSTPRPVQGPMPHDGYGGPRAPQTLQQRREPTVELLWVGESAPSLVGTGHGIEAQKVWLPPPAECIQWIQELDQMYSAEVVLKLELIDSIDIYTMNTNTLQGVAHLWSIQPNLLPDTLALLCNFTLSLNLETESRGTER